MLKIVQISYNNTSGVYTASQNPEAWVVSNASEAYQVFMEELIE